MTDKSSPGKNGNALGKSRLRPRCDLCGALVSELAVVGTRVSMNGSYFVFMQPCPPFQERNNHVKPGLPYGRS
eukprot:3809509-Rhodomonas_salina.2